MLIYRKLNLVLESIYKINAKYTMINRHNEKEYKYINSIQYVVLVVTSHDSLCYTKAKVLKLVIDSISVVV